MTNIKEKINIRPVVTDDVSFIYATWLRGLYHGNSWFREIDPGAYFKTYHSVLEFILFKRKDVKCSVAVLKEDPNIILGYCVTEPTILHWIFVKKPWRKMGIAKALLPEDIKTVTHLTKVGKAIKPKEWGFNPFL